MTSQPATIEGPWGVAGRALLLALAIAVCGGWAIQFTHGPQGLSTIWPVGGVLFGVLLAIPRRQWPAYLAAAAFAFVAINFTAHGPGAQTLMLGIVNTCEPLAIALLVRLKVRDPAHPASVKRSAVYATIGTLLACLVSALLGATAMSPDSPAEYGWLFLTWFASHVLGVVIFGVLVLVAARERWLLFAPHGQRLGLALGLVLVALVCELVFRSASFPWPFLILPPLLLLAFRYRLSGFALGTALVAAIVTTEHALGNGPFIRMMDYEELPRTLALQVFIASACLLTLPVALVLTGRDVLARRLAASERDYRLLADHSHDLIVRITARGESRYVSPSAEPILGWTPVEFAHLRWGLLHPDDAAPVRGALNGLLERGGTVTVLFRARHKDGRYLWIEANAALLPVPDGADAEIIYSGRDVTQRVIAEKALRHNERRLQAITANLPALVLHLDDQERYTFVNSFSAQALGSESHSILGRRARDVLSPETYTEVEPYMRAALSGKSVTFETERYFHGELCHYQSNYVPDVGEDGAINGFYAVSFDITALKRAQTELALLARHDTLTGLANRRQFIERLERAVARSMRSQRPVALLYLDIDHFKSINDTCGHAGGDAVLREFAQRLLHSVRDVDLVARLGGDEFVVVVEEMASEKDAQAIAIKLIQQLEAPIAVPGVAPMRIGTSVGIALGGYPSDDAETLLGKADAALYEAKRAGRNTWRMAG